MMMSSAIPNFMGMPYAFPPHPQQQTSHPANNFNPCPYTGYNLNPDHRSTSIAALRLKAREHSVALGGMLNSDTFSLFFSLFVYVGLRHCMSVEQWWSIVSVCSRVCGVCACVFKRKKKYRE